MFCYVTAYLCVCVCDCHAGRTRASQDAANHVFSGDWQVQVKNTFIEVSDNEYSDTDQDQGVFRRTRSVPLF